MKNINTEIKLVKKSVLKFLNELPIAKKLIETQNIATDELLELMHYLIAVREEIEMLEEIYLKK